MTKSRRNVQNSTRNKARKFGFPGPKKPELKIQKPEARKVRDLKARARKSPKIYGPIHLYPRHKWDFNHRTKFCHTQVNLMRRRTNGN